VAFKQNSEGESQKVEWGKGWSEAKITEAKNFSSRARRGKSMRQAKRV
jgi:hypothetical protein